MTDSNTRQDSMPRWTAYMPLDDVLAAPRNPKNHATHVLRASMERFGIVEVPALDERTGRLVAGHGRLEDWRTARADGAEPPEGVVVAEDGTWTVPVSRGWASADDTEAEAYLITSNKSSELGGWDEGGLEEMLAGIAREDFGLAQVTGVGAAELELILEAYETEASLPPLPDPGELFRANGIGGMGGGEGSAGYANPTAEAPWMAATAPQYSPPSGSALAEAHRAAHGDQVIEHEDVPATGARYAETPEQEAARTERIAAYKKITSGGLVEMILVYTQDDRTEVGNLVNAARKVLGSDLKASEIMLRGLRVLTAVLDGRDSAEPVDLSTIAKHAGYVADEQQD